MQFLILKKNDIAGCNKYLRPFCRFQFLSIGIEIKKAPRAGCVSAVRNARSAAALQAWRSTTQTSDGTAPALQPAEAMPHRGAPGTQGGNGCSG